jgi:hypothetical protein
MRLPSLAVVLALIAAPASAFTVYDSGGSARGGAHYGDPDGQSMGVGERGKSAAVTHNYTSIYSGVMPGTHEILPPPSSLFKTAKAKPAKPAKTARATR